MASVALRISEEFKDFTNKLPWVNWSELAREEAIEKGILLEKVKEFERIVSKSKLTEKDALKLAKEINRGMHKKLRKSHPGLL